MEINIEKLEKIFIAWLSFFNVADRNNFISNVF